MTKKTVWSGIGVALLHYVITVFLFLNTIGPTIAYGEMIRHPKLPLTVALQSKILGAFLLPATPFLMILWNGVGVGNGSIWPFTCFVLLVNSAISSVIILGIVIWDKALYSKKRKPA